VQDQRRASEDAGRPVNRVAIVGAGTMGGGIARACVNAGMNVVLKETSPSALDAGLATIRKNYEVSVKRGRFTPAQVEDRLTRIQPQLGYDGFETADLVIEAVFESLDLKRRIFAELDGVTKPDAVLGTNTSTLDIDVIANATRVPPASSACTS
jgi:3-hydroxyacyl-CoA dehydrogenase